MGDWIMTPCYGMKRLQRLKRSTIHHFPIVQTNSADLSETMGVQLIGHAPLE